MKSSTNKVRLNNLLRGMQKSINLFASQGYNDVYFTAQFLRGKQKQNGIERGDVSAFITQIRTYVDSEDADTVRIEFFDDSSSKSIYSKVLTGLRTPEANEKSKGSSSNEAGLGGFNGLGEAEFNALVDKRVEVKEQAKDYIRTREELEKLRVKYEALEAEKDEIEDKLRAKSETEHIMGIIGTAFPGLATLFQGTRLANAANFLAGTSDISGNALPAPQESMDSETASITAMVSEFCNTLNAQEASTIHLLFMAFEKDRNLMQRALQHVSIQTPTKT